MSTKYPWTILILLYSSVSSTYLPVDVINCHNKIETFIVHSIIDKFAIPHTHAIIKTNDIGVLCNTSCK